MANAAPPTNGSPAPEKLIPRLYQQEIFHHAVKHNVICAMDTGSGKTQIAVMLIKHIMSLQPANANPKKVAVFLVSSVPLVDQQADFLKSQIPLRVKKFYGAMGVDLWDRERWAHSFAESDIMVMTAQVFHDLLSHAHWHISKVSLIIFDEAHHCNKKHVYAQIMKVHYFHCRPEDRPRIFGMTASPIFNIRNPVMSLAKLEELMDSKVLAVRDNILELALNAPRPIEFLAKYTAPHLEYPDYPTPTMWTVLEEYQHVVLPDLDDVRDLRTRFVHVREELGPLAADYFILLFLRRAITKETASFQERGRYYIKKEMASNGVTNSEDVQTWSKLDDAYNHHADRIQDLADNLSSLRVSLWFTPKLRLLIQVLEAHSGGDFSAIIFVEQRQIAIVLAWLLPTIPQLREWVKTAALVGHGLTGGPTFEGNGMAHTAQRSIVNEFRKGETNLVIATSVAEEGLDFQACSLVIRLDAPQTMIGYLQSRGRARRPGSNYVVLADEAGAKRFNGFREAEPDLRRIYQRIHEEEEEKDSYMDLDEDEEDDNERYVVDSTGAVVTPTSSIGLLHLWCSLLIVDKFTKPPAPEFHVVGNFICTVTIPPSILNPSLCGPMTGVVRKTRDGARRSAAFRLIQRLHKLELFDDYLMPFRKTIPASDLPQSQTGPLQRIGEYFETMSPWGDVWQANCPVWMNALSLDGSEPKIALVTGKPQPARDLRIYKRGGDERIKLYRASNIEFTSEEERQFLLESMQRYSNCVFYWAISSRKLPSRSACLIIPLKNGRPDYDTMNQLISLTPKLSKEEWLDPSLQGRHAMEAHRLGSQSYKLLGVRPGLTLASAPVLPEGADKCREYEHETYRSYWAKATNIVKREVELDIPEDDCWLELASAEKADFRSQGLFGLVNIPDTNIPASRSGRIIVPSHMARISPIPPDIVEFCRHIPNILGQMTVLLRMDSAHDILQTHGVPLEVLVEALTLPSVQAGFDYQRLETLGDSVLKVSTCTHLFLKYPGHHEGQLTAIKDSIVSNANLMIIGKKGPLAKFLITERMPTRRTWKPPASSTVSDDIDIEDSSDGESTQTQVTFHTKSLADCTESTLGAAYLSLGIEAALKVGHALGLPIGGTQPWHLRKKPEFSEPTEMAQLFAPIQEKLGYTFVNPSLVVEAFTHTAYDLSKGPSYNRLEFLGDSLIDLYVLKYMYLKFEKMTPGQMSWARSRLVNATTFGKLGVGLGLHQYMLTLSTALQKEMTSFAAEVEEISLQEILHTCWKIDAPKAISDVFESIFGAIFVDSSFDLELTFNIIGKVMSDIMQLILPDMPGDPTSELVRWVAGQGCEAQGSTIFRSSSSPNTLGTGKDTVETTVHGRMIANVTAATAKLARPMAAQATLDILKDESHQYALSKICTCPRAVMKRMVLSSSGNA